jgi:hypothetical protein
MGGTVCLVVRTRPPPGDAGGRLLFFIETAAAENETLKAGFSG